MKYLRLDRGRGPEWAQADGDRALLLDSAPWLNAKPSGETVALDEVRLLAPVQPTKVVCVGRNYAEHAAEMAADLPKEPLLFLKPPSALLAPGGVICFPKESKHVSYEGELAVVIGRACSNVAADEALHYVFGLTAANDVTARDLQKQDGQWTRGKGFDTFLPVGPYLVTELAWDALSIVTRVNDDVLQNGRTNQMAFGVPQLISYISGIMTLEPGDLILTGTPPGVGSIHVGDHVEVEIEGIGRLKNSVGAK